jgi:hypothetical protein
MGKAIVQAVIRDGGSMTVNRLRHWSDLVRSCEFTEVDPQFTEARFGLKDDGCEAVDIRVVSFRDEVDTAMILRTGKDARLEPFDVNEFLVFSDWNRDQSITLNYATVGAIGQLVPGAKPYVPYVRRTGAQRSLRLAPLNAWWDSNWRFLFKTVP